MSELAPELDKFVIPEPMSGCWLWLGGLDWDNYGMAWDKPLKRTARAHRVVYERLVGPIPKGLKLLHRCDNTYCVNPEHMIVGTTADNNADMRTKKRHAHGTTHGMNKITPDQALAIKAAPGFHREIAAQFGVSKPLVTAIKSGRLWKHLEGGIQ